MYHEKILIVDDDKAICLTMQEELINHGYTTVDYTYSGEEAVEKVKLKNYDIVFLDIVLPGISGMKVVPIIKNISPEAKIIFMSGEVGAELIRNDLKKTTEGEKTIFLYKPFKEDEIVETLEELLKELKLNNLDQTKIIRLT